MGGLVPLFKRDVKKWYRNPMFIGTALIQPLLWVAFFGNAFSRISQYGPNLLGGAPTYITYMFGGVLTLMALFTSMFAGMGLVWDRRLGPLGRFLMSPIKRSSIVISKIIFSVLRVLIQTGVLVVAAFFLPGGLVISSDFTIYDTVILITSIVLISFIFSSLFTILAIRARDWNTVASVVNLINLPLMFASYAMFPSNLMSGWLNTIATWNPVSWSSEAIRTVLINGSLTQSQWNSEIRWLGALVSLAITFLILTIWLSEKGIQSE